MSVILSQDISSAYAEVRDDHSPVNWAIFSYQTPKNIVLEAKGNDGYAGLSKFFKPDNRVYGFYRVQTGDDLSSRAKFVFIVWIGEDVSPLQRARVSTDKSILKDVVREFSCEIFANVLEEVSEESILKKVIKNMGANYGSSIN